MDKPPPVVFDDDNPEWTEEDFARARPAADVLPPEVLAAFGPGKVARAVPDEDDRDEVTLHLDRDTLSRFRAAGPDWEDRINEALRRAAA